MRANRNAIGAGREGWPQVWRAAAAGAGPCRKVCGTSALIAVKTLGRAGQEVAVPAAMTRAIGKQILLGTDFSEHAEVACAIACNLARAMNGTVHFLHVVQMPMIPGPDFGVLMAGPAMQDASARAREQLTAQVERWRNLATIGSVDIMVGDPRACLVDTAHKLGVDVIVVGTHGRRGLGRMLMGSVAEHVVRTSAVPVLAVPMQPGP